MSGNTSEAGDDGYRSSLMFPTPLSAYRSPHQDVLNESWPYRRPDGSTHAIGIPTRPGIDVDVRIVWKRDGEQWVPGVADRWTQPHVHVSVSDERLPVPGIWVLARDVRRRTTGST